MMPLTASAARRKRSSLWRNSSAARRFSVAPMMDWTDRHCRYLHRLLTSHALLFTEMVNSAAVVHGPRERLLAPGGVLIIAVPNYESDDARYYGAYWAAYDVPRHLYHFSRQSMEQLLLKNNLPCIRQLPMIFDSYYVSLLSNQYQSGHSNWLKALWRGWRSNRKAGKLGTSSVIYVEGKM